MSDDEFERIRNLKDPMQQAIEATELMGVYQQRSIELARLRRVAIDRVAEDQSSSFTAVAQSLGLSKGRVSQIRKAAPPAERIVFGVGPVDLIFAGSEDEYERSPEAIEARAALRWLLETKYRFTVRTAYVDQLPMDWKPRADSVVILGFGAGEGSPTSAAPKPSTPPAPPAGGRSAPPEQADEQQEGKPQARLTKHAAQPWSVFTVASRSGAGLLIAAQVLLERLHDIYEQLGGSRFQVVVTASDVDSFDLSKGQVARIDK